MGILADPAYWAHVSNEMWKFRPVRGRVMSSEDTIRFLRSACRALDDLLNDRELSSDLDRMAEMTTAHPIHEMPYYGGGLESFLEEFSRAEAVLLLQSGIRLDCAVDIVEELRRAARFTKTITPSTIHQLHDHLRPLREVTCKTAESEAAIRDHGLRRRYIWSGIKGWTAISIDFVMGVGAHVIDPVMVGPISMSLVSTLSIGFGATSVKYANDNLHRL